MKKTMIIQTITYGFLSIFLTIVVFITIVTKLSISDFIFIIILVIVGLFPIYHKFYFSLKIEKLYSLLEKNYNDECYDELKYLYMDNIIIKHIKCFIEIKRGNYESSHRYLLEIISMKFLFDNLEIKELISILHFKTDKYAIEIRKILEKRLK